ncbi:MAG: MaoC family dehydratase [Candidatus Neomarinimicrobiota bacterium]
MDIFIGQTAERATTLTPEKVDSYAELTGDRNPVHFENSFIKGTKLKRLIVQGGLTTGLLHALVANDLPGPGTVFLNQEWQFSAPVYIGDTITATATVVEKHPVKPVVRLEMTIKNQDGVTVLKGHAWCYIFSPKDN